LINDYQFILTISNEMNYGFILEYQKSEIRVHLFFDYRENVFYFYLVRGSETKIPNDHDFEYIKLFYELFKKYDTEITPDSLDPNDEGYELALNKNVELLKKYGEKVLRDIEWI
jgi:hypothetical protein